MLWDFMSSRKSKKGLKSRRMSINTNQPQWSFPVGEINMRMSAVSDDRNLSFKFLGMGRGLVEQQ